MEQFNIDGFGALKDVRILNTKLRLSEKLAFEMLTLFEKIWAAIKIVTTKVFPKSK